MRSSSTVHRTARTTRVLGALALAALGCDQENTAPSNPEAPPGAPKKTDTQVLEKGAEALQNLSPVRSIDMYLNGFHVMKDEPGHKMEAHHYCRNMNEEFTQCVIFDGNTDDANLIGIEYIISEALFETLPEDEKASWHPHNYEILSGQLVLPGVPEVAEKATLRKKMNSYGKTWHIWDTGHLGHPAAHKLPVGAPLLAWSPNREHEIPETAVAERDKRLELDSKKKREGRAEFRELAKPQMGVNTLKGKIPGAGETLPGVEQK